MECHPSIFRNIGTLLGYKVSKTVLSILPDCIVPLGLNETFIVLILKKNKPKSDQEFQLVSLCSVIHKIIAKMIANRLKLLLLNIISYGQSTFVLERTITDNIPFAYEIVDLIIGKRRRGVMSITSDMSKVYNRVE